VPERSSQPVTSALAGLVADLDGTVAVAARDLVSGRELMFGADEPVPLASVYKVPLMVAVLRAVDANRVALDERVILAESDKSPSQGGILCSCHAGLQPTVRDLLYFSITQSDNTAADLLWRKLGPGAINAAMRELGLQTIDCFMPNREFFLMEAGLGEGRHGLTGPQIAARWRELDTGPAARESALAALRAEFAHLTGAEFTRLYDKHWGLGGEQRFDDAFAIDRALDNVGSPRDVMDLLAMIAQDRCASPPSCRLMLEILTRQEWRHRIPAGLPRDLRIGNKTGSLAGVVNDVAVVWRPSGGAYILCIFCSELSAEAAQHADAVIAQIAALVHDHLGGS
jgi:beta-lactamase class A